MATIGPARYIHNSVNDLIKNTILEVEKVLNRLPQIGDRVDVVTMPEDKASNEVDISLGEDRNALSTDDSSSVGHLSSSKPFQFTGADKGKHHKRRKRQKATAHVLSDSIRVLPMENTNGMIIDMKLRLHKRQPEETQLIDIRLECPNYKPGRIRVDGQWYNVV